MKYTARGESRVANIALGEAKCYICHERAVYFIQTKWQCLSVLLYFTLSEVLTKYTSLIVLNKGIFYLQYPLKIITCTRGFQSTLL